MIVRIEKKNPGTAGKLHLGTKQDN